MLSKKIKVSLIALAAVFSVQAYADTGFKVPVHYNVELVDGIEDYSGYSRFSRMRFRQTSGCFKLQGYLQGWQGHQTGSVCKSCSYQY